MMVDDLTFPSIADEYDLGDVIQVFGAGWAWVCRVENCDTPHSGLFATQGEADRGWHLHATQDHGFVFMGDPRLVQYSGEWVPDAPPEVLERLRAETSKRVERWSRKTGRPPSEFREAE